MKQMRAYLCPLLLSMCLRVYAQLPDEHARHWKQMHDTKAVALTEFNDAKFGLFIHWGLYSQLGGEWKGEKILIRGNHDYWWSSKTTNKVRRVLPAGIRLIHNDSVVVEDVNGREPRLFGQGAYELEERFQPAGGSADAGDWVGIGGSVPIGWNR